MKLRRSLGIGIKARQLDATKYAFEALIRISYQLLWKL